MSNGNSANVIIIVIIIIILGFYNLGSENLLSIRNADRYLQINVMKTKSKTRVTKNDPKKRNVKIY